MSQNGLRRSRRNMAEEEVEEEEGVVLAKVKQLAEFLRSSNYTVVYTGAGISTAAGIPDFRGPAGVWTLQAKGKTIAEPDFTKLNPTFSHKTLKTLVETGHVCHIVTQNIDNLHRRSGVLAENQSELHGNYSLETCPLCEARYCREFAVWQGLTAPSTANSNAVAFRSQGNSGSQKSAAIVTVTKKQGQSHDHRTGRFCEVENCCGELKSSVVLFGENLPAKEVELAWEHTDRADLAIVLGSSLKVGPACDMPVQVAKNGGKLVIINLQRTPFDGRAALVIHSRCDEVMQLLAQELVLEPTLKRHPHGLNTNIECPLYLTSKQNQGELLLEGTQVDDYELKRQEFEQSFMIQLSS